MCVADWMKMEDTYFKNVNMQNTCGLWRELNLEGLREQLAGKGSAYHVVMHIIELKQPTQLKVLLFLSNWWF